MRAWVRGTSTFITFGEKNFWISHDVTLHWERAFMDKWIVNGIWIKLNQRIIQAKEIVLFMPASDAGSHAYPVVRHTYAHGMCAVVCTKRFRIAKKNVAAESDDLLSVFDWWSTRISACSLSVCPCHVPNANVQSLTFQKTCTAGTSKFVWWGFLPSAGGGAWMRRLLECCAITKLEASGQPIRLALRAVL